MAPPVGTAKTANEQQALPGFTQHQAYSVETSHKGKIPG